MTKVFMKLNFFLISACLLLIGLSGCARYKAMPLRPLKNSSLLVEQGCISFDYMVFDEEDCEEYLDRNVIDKGYQPIQVTLTNNTDRYFTLSLNHCGVHAKEVAQASHTNTKARALGYGLAGVASSGLLFVPAIVDGIGSSNANKKLDRDFSQKALRRKQTVQPYTTINGLLFIDCDDYDDNNQFTLCLTDQKTNQQFTLSPSVPKIKI